MPLDLPDASSSPAPVAPTVSISGGVNQKRVQNAKKDADVTLLAYVTEPGGTAYTDTSAISATHTSMLASQFGDNLGEYSDVGSTVGLLVTVDDATGWVGSQDPLWNPAIDGDEGYTVKVNLPASLLDEVGLYTFRLEVTSASAGTFHQVWDIRVNG